jgi:ADP-heptose:LPS heptosyltransferase
VGFDSVRARLEKWGRELLIAVLGLLFRVRRGPVQLPEAPAIIVLRLDERVGNLVMLTPLLASLRARFPAGRIELLAHHRGRALLGAHPALDRFIPFDKRRLLAAHGPLAAPFVLRRGRYDLAIDAANPTDPSTTQAILVRLSGARHTVGFAEGAFARFYSAPVRGAGAGPHEIDMRLALLAALPGERVVRETSLMPLPSPSAPLVDLVASPYGVVNIGARLGDKRLDAEAYAAVARRVAEAGLACLLLYGPDERELAGVVATMVPGARLAPPTSLIDLAVLAQHARVFVTCDTGPMHVAVAAGAPTCGLFVSTDPTRYGYAEPPHAAVDTRGRAAAAWLGDVDRWLNLRLGQRSRA